MCNNSKSTCNNEHCKLNTSIENANSILPALKILNIKELISK